LWAAFDFLIFCGDGARGFFTSKTKEMKTGELISIGLFTVALVWTVYAWYDRVGGGNRRINEAFANEMDIDAVVKKAAEMNEPVPTDADAVAAHQTLLRYIRNDFSKGIKFVMDLGRRFYGDDLPLRSDLDVRRLMDNYSSPLQIL
jgi:hypothetical protein